MVVLVVVVVIVALVVTVPSTVWRHNVELDIIGSTDTADGSV